MNKIMKEERGSTLIIVVAILIAAIFMSFVFFDIFTTFANKRVSQTSADAGALAAAKEIREAYEGELRAEVLNELRDLDERIGEELDELLEELLDERDEEDEDEEEIDEDELLDDIYEEWEIPESILDRLEDPTAEIDIVDAIEFFFDGDHGDVTAIMCRGVQKQWEQVEGAATYYAEKNGAVNEGPDDVTVRFPYDGEFKVQVYAKRNPSYVTVSSDDLSNNDLFAQAAADVESIPGFEFIASRCQ
ncbi:pilus assembly FimT family protein [Alteribacter aurantiacus]|uniref:pilus assembly FimT family protein n=1 Tax=Alteribacter aurantiacus TaxID=254410 RepID=UPI0004029843|nr:pilus assembly protein TadG-related protein [Alteribacter aurantiacus]